jgi:NitT/TauT family transport system substrate-binding protein
MSFQMGYFKEEGLEIEMVRIRGSGTLVPQVANKSVDIGWPNPDVVIKTAQPGRDKLPVKFFYNHLSKSVWEVIVPADSPVRTIKALKGRKIGISRLSSGSIPILQAILFNAGLDISKDVELVPVGFGGPAFRAIQQGQVNSLFLFDIMHEILQGKGFKIRRLPLAAAHRNLLGNGFLVHQDMIKTRSHALIGFGRAITKGSLACIANTAACVRMYWKHYPEKKPRKGSDAKNIAKNVTMLNVRFPRLIPDPTSKRIGAYGIQSWKDFVEVLAKAGKLSTRNIPVETLYTNELIDKINDFDHGAVIAAAKALR